MNIQDQFNMIAKEYDENRRKFIPCFDDYYVSTTDFAAKSLAKKPELIFDLGSGTGLLPSFWYPHFPDANYVLSDIAEEMISVAKKRFENVPNIKYEISDYSKNLEFSPFFSVPDVIRTRGLPLRRRTLYPAELQKRIKNRSFLPELNLCYSFVIFTWSMFEHSLRRRLFYPLN